MNCIVFDYQVILSYVENVYLRQPAKSIQEYIRYIILDLKLIFNFYSIHRLLI